jgi:hypothetical protein
MSKPVMLIFALSWAAALVAYGVTVALAVPEPFAVLGPVLVSIAALVLLVQRQVKATQTSLATTFFQDLGRTVALAALFASTYLTRSVLGADAAALIVVLIVPAHLLVQLLIIRDVLGGAPAPSR